MKWLIVLTILLIVCLLGLLIAVCIPAPSVEKEEYKCPHFPIDGICIVCGEKLWEEKLYMPKESDPEYIKELALLERANKAMMWATIAAILEDNHKEAL